MSRILCGIIYDAMYSPSPGNCHSREGGGLFRHDGSVVACYDVWAEVVTVFGHAQARRGGTARDRDRPCRGGNRSCVSVFHAGCGGFPGFRVASPTPAHTAHASLPVHSSAGTAGRVGAH
jgi:hypothetical protein